MYLVTGYCLIHRIVYTSLILEFITIQRIIRYLEKVAVALSWIYVDVIFEHMVIFNFDKCSKKPEIFFFQNHADLDDKHNCKHQITI